MVPKTTNTLPPSPCLIIFLRQASLLRYCDLLLLFANFKRTIRLQQGLPLVLRPPYSYNVSWTRTATRIYPAPDLAAALAAHVLVITSLAGEASQVKVLWTRLQSLGLCYNQPLLPRRITQYNRLPWTRPRSEPLSTSRRHRRLP